MPRSSKISIRSSSIRQVRSKGTSQIDSVESASSARSGVRGHSDTMVPSAGHLVVVIGDDPDLIVPMMAPIPADSSGYSNADANWVAGSPVSSRRATTGRTRRNPIGSVCLWSMQARWSARLDDASECRRPCRSRTLTLSSAGAADGQRRRSAEALESSSPQWPIRERLAKNSGCRLDFRVQLR